jgi:alpha-1,2-mannosyltransferase
VSPRPGSMGWSRTLSTGMLVAAAGVSLVSLLAIAPSERLGWDFRFAYLRAAELVANGNSPYPELDDPVIGSGMAYVYPPQLAVMLSPLTALPADLVVGFAFVVSLAALVAALAVLGVRDLRCYAALLAWGPASSALEMANVSALLALALALVWRYRPTVWPLATILGLAIATKLLLWPLAVWALATRRSRAAALSLAFGAVLTFSAWGVIGFAGLIEYPELVRRFAEVMGAERSYSMLAVGEALGFGPDAGQALGLLVGGVLLGVCVHLGRRNADDEGSFIAAIGAALVLAPVVWLHYLVVLVVPLAISRPRFSPIWLLPIVLWVCPRDDNRTGIVSLLPMIVVFAILVMLLVRPRRAFDAPASATA